MILISGLGHTLLLIRKGREDISMKYKIFVSGVQKELKSERLAVKELVESDVLLKEYFNVFLFEKAPAGSKPSKVVYLKEDCNCSFRFTGNIRKNYS